MKPGTKTMKNLELLPFNLCNRVGYWGLNIQYLSKYKCTEIFNVRGNQDKTKTLDKRHHDFGIHLIGYGMKEREEKMTSHFWVVTTRSMVLLGTGKSGRKLYVFYLFILFSASVSSSVKQGGLADFKASVALNLLKFCCCSLAQSHPTLCDP